MLERDINFHPGGPPPTLPPLDQPPCQIQPKVVKHDPNTLALMLDHTISIAQPSHHAVAVPLMPLQSNVVEITFAAGTTIGVRISATGAGLRHKVYLDQPVDVDGAACRNVADGDRTVGPGLPPGAKAYVLVSNATTSARRRSPTRCAWTRSTSGGRARPSAVEPPAGRVVRAAPLFAADRVPVGRSAADSGHPSRGRDRAAIRGADPWGARVGPRGEDVVRAQTRRHLAAGLGRGQDHDLLHVRLSLRHQGSPHRRPDPLHRGQSRPSGQPRRAVRQGRGRDHAALRARAPDQAAEADRRAGGVRLRGDRVGRGARDGHRVARPHPLYRSAKARVLHRARPEPGADRLVGEPVRHPELRRARRLLLGQHGRGRACTRSAARSGSSASPTGSAPATSCCSAAPRITTATRSRSGSASSRVAASSSSRSIPCAPATRRSPTSGSASGRAPTACSCSPWSTSCCAPARSMSTICSATPTRPGS